MVFFDFSKAFDKVNHVILISKLYELGITGNILGWISAFLRGRIMSVQVAGQNSYQRNVTSGVPQGSVLGPILFIIYVNHVISSVSSECKIFADDIKIYMCSTQSDIDELILQQQRTINTIVETSRSWGLEMNAEKCVVIRFSPRNCNLPFSGTSPYKIDQNLLIFAESHSDLGITIDRTLKFHSHINNVTRMVGGMVTNILNCTL